MVKQKISKPTLVSYPPVVAVLGHIDHGKTTLLDFVRKTHVAQKEAGGITQHIGAYQAKVRIENEERLITFIDTPGHEAFSKMRSRGAKVADIALLVISAKDGVMPQTKESIAYIKEAKIPMIVAINKIDLFRSKAEREAVVRKIEKQLKKLNVVVEREGGGVVSLPVSAKTGQNVKDLLEMIILLSEIKGIRGKKDAPLKGVIIDSQVDRRRGVLATVLVREGSLKVKDLVEAEKVKGKVRAMFDEYQKSVKVAGPSKPVQVLGFKQPPAVGAIVKVLGEKEESLLFSPSPKRASVKDFLSGEEEGLRVILKTDTLGTKEAILPILSKKAEIVSSGIGDITQSDVFLAKTSQAPILGFNVNLLPEIRKLAQNEGVKIKIYDVIYKLLEEVEEIAEFLKEVKKEKILGKAEIIAQFEVKKKKIAGARVLEGRIARGDRVKILRGDKEIAQGRIVSLRYKREDIPKAEIGQECGIGFSQKLDFQVGDVVKSIG